MSDILERLRSLVTFGNLSEIDKSAFETYRRHRLAFGVGGASTAVFQKTNAAKFKASGDHVTITYCSGAVPIYVRVGSEENPFIRVREGMVIKRRFREIEVRIGTMLLQNQAAALTGVIELYSSFGELMTQPPLEEGVTRSFWAEEITITSTGFSPLVAYMHTDLSSEYVLSAGRHGGTIILKNTSAATPIYLHPGIASPNSGYPALGSHGFPIGPGESLSLRLRDVFLSDLNPGYAGADLTNQRGPQVYTTVAGATLAILLSSAEVDLVQPEQLVAPNALQPWG